MKPYWSTSETADFLGFSRKTVEMWCRLGKVRATRPAGPDGAYRIPGSEILRLQNPHPRPAPDPTQPPDDDWDVVSRNVGINRSGS